MRRTRTFLLGTLMVVGLLIGPGAGLAAAGRSVSGVSTETGWACHPNGSGTIGGPTTTISAALLFDTKPGKDSITCFFPNIAQVGSAQVGNTVEVGGDCYFNAGMTIGVEFRHRIYTVRGNTASLFCWDGFFVCMEASVKAPAVAVCSVTAPATTRRNLR